MAKLNNKQVAVGLGLAAAAAGAGYYFFGSPKAETNRKKVRKWASEMETKVKKNAKKLDKLDKKAYATIVDEAMKAYQSVKSVDAGELAQAAKELKDNWKTVEAELKRTVGKETKVVAKTAKVASKKVASVTKKAVAKVAKATAKVALATTVSVAQERSPRSLLCAHRQELLFRSTKMSSAPVESRFMTVATRKRFSPSRPKNRSPKNTTPKCVVFLCQKGTECVYFGDGTRTLSQA
jgi:hypothetical protein